VRLQATGRGLDLGPQGVRAGWRAGSPGGCRSGACGPAGPGRTCGPGPGGNGDQPFKGLVPTFSASAQPQPQQGDAYIVQRRGRHAFYVWMQRWSTGSMQGAIQGPAGLREQLALRDRTGTGVFGVRWPSGAAGQQASQGVPGECLAPLARWQPRQRAGLVGTGAAGSNAGSDPLGSVFSTLTERL